MIYPPKIRKRLLLLGYYQLTGGIIGVALIAWFLFFLSSFNSMVLIIIVPAFLLFFFSAYCGYLLIQNKDNGIRLSIVNQWLQLISFALGGWAFRYVSGLYLTMGFDFNDSFTFMFGFGISSWTLNINVSDGLAQLDFNFVALIVIMMLHDLKKQIKVKQTTFLFEERGSSSDTVN